MNRLIIKPNYERKRANDGHALLSEQIQSSEKNSLLDSAAKEAAIYLESSCLSRMDYLLIKVMNMYIWTGRGLVKDCTQDNSIDSFRIVQLGNESASLASHLLFCGSMWLKHTLLSQLPCLFMKQKKESQKKERNHLKIVEFLFFDISFCYF